MIFFCIFFCFQGSVRGNLSKQKCFVRVENVKGGKDAKGGKGGKDVKGVTVWTVDEMEYHRIKTFKGAESR